MNVLDLFPQISWIKLIPYAIGGVALIGGFIYIKGKFDDAAKVPQLEQLVNQKQSQLDYTYGRISVIGNKLILVQKDRDKYHNDLIAAYATIDEQTQDLINAKKNSPVSNNAICKPTDAERVRFNTIVRSLQQQFEQPTETGGLPKAK